MTLLAMAAALSLGDIYLQSLVPTSGAGIDAVLDGKIDTGWKPEGTPIGEGITFRFEEPVDVKSVEVQGCAGSETAELDLVFDGFRREVTLKDGKGKTSPSFKWRTLFLKVESGSGCIAEVNFTGLAGNVKPPRTVHGKVSVSSVLTPADAYHPGYMFDGRLDFGWVEGSKGTGEGEWLTITLDAPATVSALEIWNGYQRSPDHFQKNCRPKKVTLSIDGGEGIALELADRDGPQKLPLPKAVKGSAFKLTIDEVVKGSKYTDMVISEVRFHDEQGPLEIDTDDVKERAAALKTEVSGKPLEALVGARMTSVCPEGQLTVKLRSNHTFAFYEDTTRGSVSINEVVDGAWIVKSDKAIELFGRRQKISVDDRPYGSGTRETVQITGGPVNVTRVKDLGKDAYAKLLEKWKKGPAKRHVGCAGASFDAAGDAVVLEGVALTGLVTVR